LDRHAKSLAAASIRVQPFVVMTAIGLGTNRGGTNHAASCEDGKVLSRSDSLGSIRLDCVLGFGYL